MTRIGQIFALDESKHLQIQYIIKENEEVLSLLAKQVMDEIFLLSASVQTLSFINLLSI